MPSDSVVGFDEALAIVSAQAANLLPGELVGLDDVVRIACAYPAAVDHIARRLFRTQRPGARGQVLGRDQPTRISRTDDG